MDAARWRSARHADSAPLLKGRPIGLYVLETGGCEGCFMEIASLDGSAFSLEQSGFICVEDPADADWLLVTGALTRGGVAELDRVWRAMAPGKSLVAIGACAIDGGPFTENYATLGGLRALTPITRPIHGCPPSPEDILSALRSLAEAGKAGSGIK